MSESFILVDHFRYKDPCLDAAGRAETAEGRVTAPGKEGSTALGQLLFRLMVEPGQLPLPLLLRLLSLLLASGPSHCRRRHGAMWQLCKGTCTKLGAEPDQCRSRAWISVPAALSHRGQAEQSGSFAEVLTEARGTGERTPL